jgi:hypothetical protein
MRTGPAHNSYARARPSTADRVLEGVETAGKIYSAAHTAYQIARGGVAVATRLAPLLGLL